ncbi:MAG TPA: hypothetical protein PKX92_12050 [Edaphocola sp.]|nr:hypothetical protein [Edaphocola sp.]
MKLTALLIIPIAASTLLLQTSCKKKVYDDAPLASQWLLPILKGDISPLTITTLKNKKFSLSISGDDLGISSTTPSSSSIPMTYNNIKSGAIQTNDLIHSIALDTCLIELTITNGFPTAILAGTKFILRISGGAEIASVTLTNDIGKGQSENFTIDLSGKYLENQFEVEVETLKIDSYSNETFDQNIDFDFNIKNVSVNEISVYTDKEYLNMRDTSDFDGSDISFEGWEQKIDDSTVNATFKYLATNGLPINANFQAYFLDNTNQVIDSIFAPTAVMGGAVYNGGTLVDSTNSVGSVFVSKNRVEKIKNAKKIVYAVGLNSFGYSGSYVTINRNQSLNLKIIGDLKIVLNSNILK